MREERVEGGDLPEAGPQAGAGGDGVLSCTLAATEKHCCECTTEQLHSLQWWRRWLMGCSCSVQEKPCLSGIKEGRSPREDLSTFQGLDSEEQRRTKYSIKIVPNFLTHMVGAGFTRYFGGIFRLRALIRYMVEIKARSR